MQSFGSLLVAHQDLIQSCTKLTAATMSIVVACYHRYAGRVTLICGFLCGALATERVPISIHLSMRFLAAFIDAADNFVAPHAALPIVNMDHPTSSPSLINFCTCDKILIIPYHMHTVSNLVRCYTETTHTTLLVLFSTNSNSLGSRVESHCKHYRVHMVVMAGELHRCL